MARNVKIPNCQLDTISPDLIEEGSRFREDYGDLTDLCHSIKTNGLINPIAVMSQPAAEKPFLLVAGGRRLRACMELKMEAVPVRIFETFDELDLRLLELAENIQRKDMSWQEQNKLQREIHQLQQKKHGVKSAHSNVGWGLEDTAQMMGVSKATISESINLGEKLERYASVLGDASKYKTENDARKAVKTVEEAMIRAELARRAEAKQASNAFTQTMADNYILGDCLEMMDKYQPETFDFAEVDPPYGIDLDKIKRDNDCEGYNEIPQDEYLIFIKDVLTRVYKILKPNTFCVFWFGMDPWFEYIYKIAKEVGFKGSRIPLIWTKPNGQSLNPSQNLATAYETAFIFKKGSPVLAKPGRTNVFSYAPVAPNKKYHPTQKPLDLYQEIYNTFSFEGAKCIVPFAGSGMSMIAAATVKRQALGYDLTEEFKGGYIQAVSETFLQG